jgi:membrane-associated phospholipid phosphatase
MRRAISPVMTQIRDEFIRIFRECTQFFLPAARRVAVRHNPRMPAIEKFAAPTGRPLSRTAWLTAGSAVLICAVVVGIGWLLTHPLKDSLARHENGINRWFVDQRTSGLTTVADAGTLLGETITGAIVLVVAGIWFAVWKRTWWPLVFVAVLDAGLGLFYLAGTHLDPRQRPPVHILQSGLVADHSFPSGHTGTATAIAGAIGALLWAYTRVAKGLIVALVVLPLWTMVSRLYVGAHHLTDVLTAFLAATCWLLVCSRMLLPERRDGSAP